MATMVIMNNFGIINIKHEISEEFTLVEKDLLSFLEYSGNILDKSFTVHFLALDLDRYQS